MLLSLLLMLFSYTHEAEARFRNNVELTPADVCVEIGRRTPQNGSLCVEIVSGPRTRFDQMVLRTAMVAAQWHTGHAINVLQNGKNKFFSPSLGDTCELIAARTTGNAAECMTRAAGHEFSPNAIKVVKAMIPFHTRHALVGLSNAQNKYFDSTAAEVCVEVARRTSGNGAACIEAAADKIYRNGIEQSCLAVARNHTGHAVTCMARAGDRYHGPYDPMPPLPREIKIPTRDFQNLIFDVERANNLLYSASWSPDDLFEAQQLLQEMAQRLRNIELDSRF